MSYDHAYRVTLARRGESVPATVRQQAYAEDGRALRDEDGQRIYEEAELVQRVRHNSREGAVRSARQRIPDGLKVLYVRRVEDGGEG